jgi:DNA modification methylase
MQQLYGVDLFGESAAPKPTGPVAERFLFPPFTVLDAKSGDWLERKRAWLALGIKSEAGRNIKPTSCATEWMQRGASEEGGSIFDPVLCELAYRWFCQQSGQVVDPFAGGSVRGIVAAQLGLDYWGCDLRAEQVEANRAQAAEICTGKIPVWVVGDSMETLDSAPEADLIFSCPPYGDLEVYSDDPADLSNMEWHTFLAAYRRIILRAVGRLKPDRFACFVVGDFRDSKGFYRNFVGETVAAFEACGARLYNEAVLATPVGSACMRVTKQFTVSRKMAKTHQNVLVFCKGDPRKAAAWCAEGAAQL